MVRFSVVYRAYEMGATRDEAKERGCCAGEARRQYPEPGFEGGGGGEGRYVPNSWTAR